MKTEKVMVNGEEVDIITKLDDDYIERNLVSDINLENTLELNTDAFTDGNNNG